VVRTNRTQNINKGVDIMHLYLIARGSKDRLDRWVNDCLARYYPIKTGFIGDDGKKQGTPTDQFKLQLSMRPIQLYEVVFPKDSLNDVVAALQPYGGYGIKRGWLNALRKLLKLKPIPQGIPRTFDLNREFVDICGIGIKEDKMKENNPTQEDI